MYLIVCKINRGLGVRCLSDLGAKEWTVECSHPCMLWHNNTNYQFVDVLLSTIVAPSMKAQPDLRIQTEYFIQKKRIETNRAKTRLFSPGQASEDPGKNYMHDLFLSQIR